jgi:hypothetical protein
MSERRAFIRRRPLRVLLMVLLLVVVAVIWQNRVALNAFPKIISAYTVKEYCSCRYVMGLPADYCRGYVKQYVSISLVDDAEHKSVSAERLGQSATAVWRGERQGCVLTPQAP